MASAGGSEGDPEFQIAPMIDVLLVLLVFFMTITSAQVLKVDKAITLPIAANAQKKDNQRAEAIVNVRWNAKAQQATFMMDDHVYAHSADLVGPLKSVKAQSEARITDAQAPAFRMVIRADRDAPANAINRAMSAAAEAGISDISFSAVNRD